MMIERSHVLLIGSVLLNCVLSVCLIVTCLGTPKEKAESSIQAASAVSGNREADIAASGNELQTEESALAGNIDAELPGATQKTLEEIILEMQTQQQRETVITSSPSTGNRQSVQVSYAVQRPPSALAGISGKVNTNEIDPINFENPDLNILRQMGADRHLISFFTGEQFYKAGDWDKALTEYTAAINSYANFTEAFISRGNTWLKKGDWGRAIEDFTRSIRLEGNRAELYNYRGFARSQRGELNLAIEDFSRAISLNTNYVDALINRSHAYYQAGNYDRTIEDCSRILRLEPENAYIWNRRGSAYYHKKDDDRAIADFTEAIRLRRNYAVAWHNRGNAWQNKGNMENAHADFAMAQQFTR